MKKCKTDRKVKVAKKKDLFKITQCLGCKNRANSQCLICLKRDITALEDEIEAINEDGGIAITGYSSFLVTANTTALAGTAATSTLAITTQLAPPTAAFSWVNVNTGTLSPLATPVYADPVSTDSGPVGVRIDGVAGDEHFVLEEDGLWLIAIHERASIPTPVGAGVCVDFDIGITPPGGVGPTVPTGDGIATAGVFPTLVSATATGIIVQQFEAGTRIDLYVKGESTVVIALSLILEQNGIITFVRLAP